MSGRSYSAAKRAVDAVAAGAALVLLSPVLLGVALAVLLDDGGPVLFRQPRAGRGGDPFDAQVPDDAGLRRFERRRHVGLERRRPDDFVFKTSGSAQTRVTRVGTWLRRTSLDELPRSSTSSSAR